MDNVTQPSSSLPTLRHENAEVLKGNVEAFMECGHIWTSGCQAIGQSMAASAQARLERNLSSWKALTGVRSVKEAMDLHADMTRTSVETMLAETGKLAEASMKLAEQVMASMTARMTLAGERFSAPTLRV